MIVGIHHIALSVPDIEVAARFYMDTLGFSETFASEWDNKPLNDRVIGVDGTSAKVRMLRTSNVFVELWEYRNPAPLTQDPGYSPANHGYAHIGLQVTNIHAEYERLQRAGMTFHAPPVDLGASAAIYGRDPFGNIIELYQVTGKGALPTADEASIRLRQLEDIEAIRQLKAAYCAACDDDHNGERVAALFAPGGRWANSMGPDHTGHDAIRLYFQSIRDSGNIKHSSHMVTNPVIDVDGDRATGSWSFMMVYTSPTGDRYRIIGFYREKYERHGRRWLFGELFADIQDYSRLNATEVSRPRVLDS
jgi:glyoxylase I family protein